MLGYTSQYSCKFPYNHTAKVRVIFQNDMTEYTGFFGNYCVDSEETAHVLAYAIFWGGQYLLDDGLSGTGQNNLANRQPVCPLSCQTYRVFYNGTNVSGYVWSGMLLQSSIKCPLRNRMAKMSQCCYRLTNCILT